MMQQLRAVLAAFVLMLSTVVPAFAVEPDEVLADTALEARARALSSELRCLVCQNQSIDDSNAPLAKDLRVLVRERLKAGDSDTKVKEFLVDRYGDFVLLKPPFAAYTLILWIAPLLVLGGAVFAVRRSLAPGMKQAAAPATAPLSAEEQAKLAKLMNEKS